MSKAQKKPVIIDYLDYKGNSDSLQHWVNSFKDKLEDHFIVSLNDEWDDVKVKTLEGTSYDVTKEDVIIRGIKGEYYPCKKDIFQQTYDKID